MNQQNFTLWLAHFYLGIAMIIAGSWFVAVIISILWMGMAIYQDYRRHKRELAELERELKFWEQGLKDLEKIRAKSKKEKTTRRKKK